MIKLLGGRKPSAPVRANLPIVTFWVPFWTRSGASRRTMRRFELWAEFDACVLASSRMRFSAPPFGGADRSSSSASRKEFATFGGLAGCASAPTKSSSSDRLACKPGPKTSTQFSTRVSLNSGSFVQLGFVCLFVRRVDKLDT